LGKLGELAAEKFLQKSGYKIIAKNWRTRFGEIDIIAKDGDCFVFAEVKTRSNERYGAPEEAVTKTKQQHLLLAAQLYLQTIKENDALWRIDVLALLKDGEGYRIRHLKNAVTG
jgi:putative endonuclease